MSFKNQQAKRKRPNSNTDMIQAKPMFSVETISLLGLSVGIDRYNMDLPQQLLDVTLLSSRSGQTRI